jgi:hypothetical protein
MLRIVMATLSFLMISNVPYPAMPPVGFRSVKGLMGVVILVGGVSMLIFGKLEWFFPMAVAYVSSGLLRAGFLGLLDRRQGMRRPGWVPGGLRETDLPMEESVGEEGGAAHRRRRRRRRSGRVDRQGGEREQRDGAQRDGVQQSPPPPPQRQQTDRDR